MGDQDRLGKTEIAAEQMHLALKTAEKNCPSVCLVAIWSLLVTRFQLSGVHCTLISYSSLVSINLTRSEFCIVMIFFAK